MQRSVPVVFLDCFQGLSHEESIAVLLCQHFNWQIPLTVYALSNMPNWGKKEVIFWYPSLQMKTFKIMGWWQPDGIIRLMWCLSGALCLSKDMPALVWAHLSGSSEISTTSLIKVKPMPAVAEAEKGISFHHSDCSLKEAAQRKFIFTPSPVSSAVEAVSSYGLLSRDGIKEDFSQVHNVPKSGRENAAQNSSFKAIPPGPNSEHCDKVVLPCERIGSEYAKLGSKSELSFLPKMLCELIYIHFLIFLLLPLFWSP